MHIFPWVVGIRVLMDPSHIVSLLTFLDIPSKHSKAAVERTALASVKALYSMHQVRFGGMHGRKRAADNQQNNFSDYEATDDEELKTDLSGKWRSRLANAAQPRAAEPCHTLSSNVTIAQRKRLASEPIIPNCCQQGQIATGALPTSVVPDWETRRLKCTRP